jgi:hypothetical protein
MDLFDRLLVAYGSLCPYSDGRCLLYDPEQVNCCGHFVGDFCGRFRELVAAEEAQR